MNSSVIEKVKTHMLTLCDASDGYAWRAHLEEVVRYCHVLSQKLRADEEIVELAAWLHDIAKITGQKQDHHLHGAVEAERVLRDLGYPEERIARVSACIRTHSSSQAHLAESTEAKIVASADGIVHFDHFLHLCYEVFGMKGMTLDEGRAWLIKKCKGQWDKLMPEAKEMARERYEGIMRILGEKEL